MRSQTTRVHTMKIQRFWPFCRFCNRFEALKCVIHRYPLVWRTSMSVVVCVFVCVCACVCVCVCVCVRAISVCTCGCLRVGETESKIREANLRLLRHNGRVSHVSVFPLSLLTPHSACGLSVHILYTAAMIFIDVRFTKKRRSTAWFKDRILLDFSYCATKQPLSSTKSMSKALYSSERLALQQLCSCSYLYRSVC